MTKKTSLRCLQEGNNVRFSGINVGYVKKIEIINDMLINVEMNIDKSAMKFIKKNAVASIASDGLVGNMIVNITPNSGNVALAKSGDILKAEERLTTEDLLKTINKTNNNAEQIMRLGTIHTRIQTMRPTAMWLVPRA